KDWPNSRCSAMAAPGVLCRALRRVLARQTDGKLAPLSGAGAHHRHLSPVQFHEFAHQGEADTEARSGARIRAIGLPVKVEYVRQGLRRDADSGVSYA